MAEHSSVCDSHACPCYIEGQGRPNLRAERRSNGPEWQGENEVPVSDNGGSPAVTGSGSGTRGSAGRNWPPSQASLVQPAASPPPSIAKAAGVTTYSLTFHRLSRADLELLLPRLVEWLDRPDLDVGIRLVDDEDEGYTPEGR